jgi:hypothetical protein
VLETPHNPAFGFEFQVSGFLFPDLGFGLILPDLARLRSDASPRQAWVWSFAGCFLESVYHFLP